MIPNLRKRVLAMADAVPTGARRELALAVAGHVLQQCLRHCQAEVQPDQYDLWEEGYNEGVKSCMSHLNALLKTIQT